MPQSVALQLRKLFDDVRGSRFVPVVAGLVAALVAIPLFLLNGSSSAPAPAPVAPVAGPAPVVAPIGVTSVRPAGHLARHARDPFAQQSLPGAAAPATAASSSAGTAVTAAPAAAVKPAASSTIAASPRAASTHAAPRVQHTVSVRRTSPAPAAIRPAYRTYAPVLAFVTTGGALRTYARPDRFTVLGSLAKLSAVYIGIAKDGRTAEFLISNSVAPAGQGTCTPSRTRCVFLALRPGQRESFVVHRADGTVAHSVVSYVSLATGASPTSPLRHVKVDATGKRVINFVAKLVPALAHLSYSAAGGLLQTKLALSKAHTARTQIHNARLATFK